MAMPLRAAPPATTVWIEARHDRHATTLLRNPKQSSPNPRFSFQRKRSNERSCSLPLVAATSDSLGSKSAVTSEGLTSSLEGVDVFDITGKAIPITDLWKSRKAVVAFARHFGCVLCRKRADLLASKKELMDAAGVALVLIGPGSTEQGRLFNTKDSIRVMVGELKNGLRRHLFSKPNSKELLHFVAEVYADPSHSSFNALDFAYGVSTTFTPSAGMKIVQSYIEGYRQDWGLSLKKNTMSRGGWQQGGTLVAGPGVSNISYIHKDKEAGDDPDIEDVVKACCR